MLGVVEALTLTRDRRFRGGNGDSESRVSCGFHNSTGALP